MDPCRLRNARASGLPFRYLSLTFLTVFRYMQHTKRCTYTIGIIDYIVYIPGVSNWHAVKTFLTDDLYSRIITLFVFHSNACYRYKQSLLYECYELRSLKFFEKKKKNVYFNVYAEKVIKKCLLTLVTFKIDINYSDSCCYTYTVYI